MPQLSELCNILNEIAPLELAEDWDNVGLLIGDRDVDIDSALTCLTLTHDVADEAIASGAGLIITHHPLLFRAVQKLTSDTSEGRLLLKLIEAKVAVYAPHTGYDSAALGINAQIAERLGLNEVQVLKPIESINNESQQGAGRCGDMAKPTEFSDFLKAVQSIFQVDHLEYVEPLKDSVRRVGIACGSAGEFLRDAAKLNCDVFITGETRFHTALEARDRGIGLILLGHYTSERFAMESLAMMLNEKSESLIVTASQVERNPLRWA
ncbi:Nif3-like dinuclear metal center hexameric protein [Calycomorphotria hydatis]|uniref:GTP cyclohydrolase 1 type 2 homolog n=1 Tax=Calycomorphotria hydatis TaxID=2528027 RepID=A0A517TCP1_9PLAN|nr:Nif3-like dinuclear metal center hexameric protein [Calycomorphotria hydatis]QDT66143.1 Putative GTP cyclohydrolase 1 type 2 [Calycomorphotria hydatis]